MWADPGLSWPLLIFGAAIAAILAVLALRMISGPPPRRDSEELRRINKTLLRILAAVESLGANHARASRRDRTVH